MSAMSAMSAESSLVEMKYYFLTDSRARVIALYIYAITNAQKSFRELE